MRRFLLFVFAANALALAAFSFAACRSSLSAFTPDEAGHTQAGDAVTEIGAATGSPWLLGLGTVINLAASVFLSKKAAKDKDNEEATPADAQSMVSALRAAGYKVERAS